MFRAVLSYFRNISMTFSTFDEVARVFQLEGLEPLEVRRRLREKQAELHPDRNGGRFANENAEKEFHRLNDAIRLINSAPESTALVPISAIPEIVRAVREAIAPQTHQNTQQLLADKLEVQVNRTVEHYRPPMSTPKTTLTGVSAVLTALWAFPGMISGNPA